MIDRSSSRHTPVVTRSKLALTPLFSLALGLGTLACTADDGGDDAGVDDEPTWPMAESTAERDPDPLLEADETAAVAADQQALALDLYHVLRQGDMEGMGFSVSSYSVAAAFGMLYGGTVGEAREQMEATLHFSLGDERQHVAHNWLDRELAARNLPADELSELDPVIVETANGVWVEQTLGDALNPDYLDVLAIHYGAGVHLADFARSPGAEATKINKWVSNRTYGLIPELLPPGVVNEGTTMVLVNALYLKAPWATQFEEGATAKADFTRLDGSTVDVDMMHNYAVYGEYIDAEDYDAFAMPLRGNSLEVVFVVPDDFETFEAALDQPTLAAMFEGMDGVYVDAYIPRFSLETEAFLTEVLEKDLGMPAPFNDGSSFDDIVPGLGVITAVIHKTVIEIDENGTEAAAATAIVVGEDGGEEPQPVATFRADKPFILMIRDRPTQSMLFFGRVLEP